MAHVQSKVWLDKYISEVKSVIYCNHLFAAGSLISFGAGVGVLPTYYELSYPNLVRLNSPDDCDMSELWLLTHKDIRGSAKIKATMDFFDEGIKSLLQGHI